MPPKMNHLWKTLQKKMSDKRTQQVTRPRKGGKGTAPSEIVVQRLTAEPDNKQTYRPVQPREFVEFSSEDLTLENLKIVCGTLWLSGKLVRCAGLKQGAVMYQQKPNTSPQRQGKQTVSRLLRGLPNASNRFDSARNS